MKFWKASLFSLLLIGMLLVLLVSHAVNIPPEEKLRYREIMDVSQSKTQVSAESNYTAKQLKQGTAKTLLLSQGDERKIGVLKSRISTLLFSKANQSSEVIEEMEGVRLTYQEELIKNRSGSQEQRVLSLLAEKATYFYNQEKLVAENVQIFRYQLPLHELPHEIEGEIPYFSGTADSISLNFSRTMPTLQAKNLKATSL